MIEEFEKYLLYKEHKSLSTIKVYSRYIEQFIEWYYSSKNKEILELNGKISEEYREYLLLIKKKKVQTINVIFCALSMFNKFFYYKNSPKNYLVRKNRDIN